VGDLATAAPLGASHFLTPLAGSGHRRLGADILKALRAMARQQRHPATSASGRGRAAAAPDDVLRVPVLAEGADPGRNVPRPLAVRDRLTVERRLVGDHPQERLFAYDVSETHMRHLRGLAAPGDRVVFQRGGRVATDRICAVRTPGGVVLSRVAFRDGALLLLPGEGESETESLPVGDLKGLRGVIAGTHVLLIRR
jgi:hypothetical protein